MSPGISRRAFTFGAAGITPEIAAAWQHAHQAAKIKPAFEYFDQPSARIVEALAAAIIPSGDGSPGAREAGVVYFIDRALATWDSAQREIYQKALAGITAETPIAKIENTPFFEVLRTHTILGFYGSVTGWAQIGIEDKMAFSPPFGYYDAEAKP